MNTLPVCVPKSPQQEECYDPSTSPYPSSMMLLVLLVKVTAECFLLVTENRPFAVVRLFVAAAWLQCSAEILPRSCSLHNARRSRLAASSCLLLYITVYWYCFWPLIFFFLSFLLCHPCLSFSLNLPPFFLWLFPLLCACLGLREKGGLGAVCLKPSRVNLLRPSTVRKDCISRFPVFVPPRCFVF